MTNPFASLAAAGLLYLSLPPCAAFVATPSPARAGSRGFFPLRASSSAVADLDASRRILADLASRESTSSRLTPEQVEDYVSAIAGLPFPPPALDVDGPWELLATVPPEAEAGVAVDFFDANSWKNYLAGTGPSPVQSLATGGSRIRGLTQWLTPLDFDNVLEFRLGPLDGRLVLKASLESVDDNRRTFRFRRGVFLLRALWGGAATLPYPVPFRLLGDRALGWLDTVGYDPETGFRAAVGNKGTRFLFRRIPGDVAVPDDVEEAAALYAAPPAHESEEEEKARNAGLKGRAVLLCPQQFGGKPGDYDGLVRELRERGRPVYLARMSAFDWLTITQSAFSEAYFKGELEPSKTLGFYFDALDAAAARLGEGREFSILSHSIGGWVARAWLGERAPASVRARCRKYVSLGTPHAEPPAGSLVARLDQTRGLLRYINDRWPGAHWDGIDYTCVAATGVPGKVGLRLDNSLAFASYFALVGEGGVEGDGITPVKAALLEGAEAIVLDEVCHADVLPNPLGGTNIRLIGTKWYADKIDDWIEAL